MRSAAAAYQRGRLKRPQDGRRQRLGDLPPRGLAALAPGWRNVCGIIALLTLAGTVATGTNSVLKLSEHQARTTTCLGALAALQAGLFEEGAVRQNVLEKTKASLATVRLTYDEYFP